MQALLQAIATMEPHTDARRVFHGRGGLHPGCEHLTLDFFPPVYLLTSFQPLDEAALACIGDALAARQQQIAPGLPLNWVLQLRLGAQADTRLVCGSVPEGHEVCEDGAWFRVQLQKGQNHGLFLDMANGRRWVRRHIAAQLAARAVPPALPKSLPLAVASQDALHAVPSALRLPEYRVLNLFAYTCAFSVVALQAGAQQVVNVDMGHGALGVGQQNHQRNGVAAGASFLAHDVFSTWGKINRAGPYDLVIADPPSYQRGSFVATKDYARLVRRLPDLLVPGGYALLCLNAPELGTAFLQELVRDGAPELEFVERVANPPEFADVSPERSLKVLVYRMPGALPHAPSSAITRAQGSAGSAT